MVVTAFDPDVSLASILTGAKSIDRVLINAQGIAQTTAAQSIENIFQSRLDAVIAASEDPADNAITEALLRDQSLLVSRKSRLAEATSTISKALTQIDFLQTHIDHLNDQLIALEGGSVTAADVAADWDNKLRKINILVFDAGKVTFDDGTVSYDTNLLNAQSRTSFQTDSLLAPYSTGLDSLFIEGAYLGNDHFITDSGGDFWLSDIGFRASESDTGVVTEYSSFPDTVLTTNAETDLDLTSYVSDSSITFDAGAQTGVTGSITRGGLGLLEGWLYDRFNNATDIDRAQTDLVAAEATLLTAEAAFRSDLAVLQSGASLIDSFINGLDREIENEIEKIQNERDANLRAAEFEFEVAKFNFALLAARGNTLIQAMLIAKDTFDRSFADTTKLGEAISGSLVSTSA